MFFHNSLAKMHNKTQQDQTLEFYACKINELISNKVENDFSTTRVV